VKAVKSCLFLRKLNLHVMVMLDSNKGGNEVKDSSTIVPVIPGNYADPSIIRVGRDYYMTHTSYQSLPGLIIWHSQDLVSWEPVSAALHEYVGDVWAPDFVHHNGMYYIYFPANRTNWVVSAPSPLGPWSAPVDLGIKGIDPGHVAGQDGRRYLHISDGYLVELAEDGMSITGTPRKVYEGWRYPEDWVVEAYSMEGPKVAWKDGYYYLMVALGGTAGPPTSHMAAVSRSQTPWGPWEHSPHNPVVYTKSGKERWWSKGHASLIDTPEGDWYVVYHAYENGYATLGRQTLLQAVEWTEDGWFRLRSQEPVWNGTGLEAVTSSAPYCDSFQSGSFDLKWQSPGKLPSASYRFLPDGGIETDVRLPEKEIVPPLLYMTGHKSYEVTVKLSVTGDAEGRLLLYYSPEQYLGIGLSVRGVRHLRSFKTYSCREIGSSEGWLRIRNDNHIVSYSYSADGIQWSRYDKISEASGFHHNTLGLFLSLRIGLLAAGNGTVAFHSFQYQPL
jgi:xylan 1,4-beta-xylosidase